jgi:vancomycin resistance protein VanW
VLPWGVGCSIVYNYVDLVVRNDTATTFQLRTWVGDRHLKGELRADRPVPTSYSVEARNEEFLRVDGLVYRRNEIWRTILDKRTGDVIADELVKRNHALVKYAPPEELVREVYATTRPRSTTRAGRVSTDRSSTGFAS